MQSLSRELRLATARGSFSDNETEVLELSSGGAFENFVSPYQASSMEPDHYPSTRDSYFPTIVTRAGWPERTSGGKEHQR